MIPQEMLRIPAIKNQLEVIGITDPKRYIDKKISYIPNATHADIHKAGWNPEWKAWLIKNPKFTQRLLQKKIKLMMQKYNIPRATRNHVRRYGKNSKGCGG